MTKVIKEEFEKFESLKIIDDLFTCNTSLEFFHKEFNRISRMDDDLFTYQIEILRLASIPCDLNKEDDSEQQMTHRSDVDMEYDPSDKLNSLTKNPLILMMKMKLLKSLGLTLMHLISRQLRAKLSRNLIIFYKSIQIYLLKILMDLRLMKNIRMIRYMSGIKRYRGYMNPWTDNRVWEEPTPIEHYCEPFSFKSGCSEWPTCSWKDDGYCNGWNFSRAYIGGNTLRYQYLEWYEPLEDGKLIDEALKNKAIMEGMIDDDDESCNNGWRRWDKYENTIHDHEERENEEEHENKERCELFDNPHQEWPVYNIRRFEMIKYSFGQDEENVSIKEHEYDDLTSTNEDAYRTYQDIFHRMDEGWMVTRVV
ncbi:hypothetical protein Tco_0604070 [Tanacetum coccineum]